MITHDLKCTPDQLRVLSGWIPMTLKQMDKLLASLDTSLDTPDDNEGYSLMLQTTAEIRSKMEHLNALLQQIRDIERHDSQ